MTRDHALQALGIASEHLQGGNGECGLVAIAIRDVIFSGGQLVAVLNEHCLRFDRWVGHITVAHEDELWDLYGAHAPEDLIVDYGQIGNDMEYASRQRGFVQKIFDTILDRNMIITVKGHRVDRLPAPRTIEDANRVGIYDVTEPEVRRHMPGVGPQSFDHVVQVLRRAKTAALPGS